MIDGGACAKRLIFILLLYIIVLKCPMVPSDAHQPCAANWPLTEVRNWSSLVFAAQFNAEEIAPQVQPRRGCSCESLPFLIEFQLCMWPVCWSWEGITALFVRVCVCGNLPHLPYVCVYEYV